MAIALTIGLIAWIESPDTEGFDQLVLLVVRQIGLGLVVGVVLAVAATWVSRGCHGRSGPFAPVVPPRPGSRSARPT